MDYYKITNKKEVHNGLQYKTGLNIDPLPFDPSGDCEPGGIYFARENILAFLGFGSWIRKVTLPSDAQVYENPGKPKKWKADRVILGKRRKITLEVIKELIEEGADIHANNDYAFYWAVASGYLDIVKFLVKSGANIHANNDSALFYAATMGYLDIIKYLIKSGANIYARNNFVLPCAATMGHLDVVKFLVKSGADIHANNNYVFRWAVRNSHPDIIKYIKRSSGRNRIFKGKGE